MQSVIGWDLAVVDRKQVHMIISKSAAVSSELQKPDQRKFKNWNHFIEYLIIQPQRDSTEHYRDVIMSTMASQITDNSIVCSTFCSGANQRKHQSSASLTFVRGIHRWPVVSNHKESGTRKMFPCDDVIMINSSYMRINRNRYCHHLLNWVMHTCFSGLGNHWLR